MPSDDYKTIVSGIVPFSLLGLASACRDALPIQYRNRPWVAAYPDKNFTTIFTTEDQLNGYCAAYTAWHIAKLNLVFAKCKAVGGFNSGDISIIDWGCGQGLATLCPKEYLASEKILNYKIREIIEAIHKLVFGIS